MTCSVSSSFWTCFSNWLPEKFNQKLTLSESTFLYGWHKESNNWAVLNYCLIVAKYNIFATSVSNGVLDFDSFLLRLNNKIDILRTIAFRSDRLSQFKKTWDKLLQICECQCHFHNTYSFKLHFTAVLFHLLGLRLFPLQIQFFFLDIIYINYFSQLKEFFFVNKEILKKRKNVQLKIDCNQFRVLNNSVGLAFLRLLFSENKATKTKDNKMLHVKPFAELKHVNANSV